MTDEKTTAEDPKAAEAPDKAKADTSKTAPAKAADDGDNDDNLSPEELRKQLKGLRSEIAAKRQDSKAAKEEMKAAREELAALKAEKEAQELEKKKKNGEWEAIANDKDKALQAANERLIRSELRVFAAKEGILDPSDVNNVSIEGMNIDEKTGEVHGAEKAIKKLKADKPHWFKVTEDKAKAEEKPVPKSTSSKISDPPPGAAAEKDLSELGQAEYADRKKAFLAGLKNR